MAEVRGLKGGERKKEASRGEEHDSVQGHPCYLTFDQVLTSKLTVWRDQVESHCLQRY